MHVIENFKKLEWSKALKDKNYIKTKHWEYKLKKICLKLKTKHYSSNTILQNLLVHFYLIP